MLSGPRRSYPKGTVTGLVIRFTDPSSDALVDPSAVFFKWRIGEGTETLWQYTVDSELTKLGTGIYRAAVSDDVVGVYKWWAYATGTYKAAEQGQFVVESMFA